MSMNRGMAPPFARAATRPSPAAAPQRLRRRLAVLMIIASAAGGPATAQEMIPNTPASAPQWQWPWQWQRPSTARPTAPAAPVSVPATPGMPVAAPPLASDTSAAASGIGRADAAGAQRDRPAAKPSTPDDPTWNTLTVAQRAALEPLAREWASIDGDRKRKWLEIAERMPRMSSAQQARMQTRMTEWARMTPQSRAQVRLHFQEARQVAPHNRKESWDAYLALPVEQRRQLAERAALLAPPSAAKAVSAGVREGIAVDATGRDGVQAKSNIVSGPTPTTSQRAVSPTVVQAASGATTTLMSRRPAPPPHQQTGLPKIAAMPGFVDSTTLLPQRGAQGAAIRPVAASEPAAPRR